MKLNKYIFAALITSTTLFLGSCSDFLDRSPQGQFTEDDNPNALVNGKIYNVYTMMRNYNVTAGPPAFAIHCFRSEDSEKGSIASDGSDVAEMYDDFVYTPTNGLLGAYWGQNYAIIYQCNEILDAIAEKETAGQTETEDIINKGEASFFRAYCYFNLVRAFGEVPLVTYKINDASEANIPKTTADKIYEQIDNVFLTLLFHSFIECSGIFHRINISDFQICSHMITIIIKIVSTIFWFRFIQPEYTDSFVIIIFLNFIPKIFSCFRIRYITMNRRTLEIQTYTNASLRADQISFFQHFIKVFTFLVYGRPDGNH